MVNTKSPVFLFIGKDSYLKERAIKDLTSSYLKNHSKDLDLKVFYGGETEYSEILDYISSVPFLASRKFVVVKNLEKTSAEFIPRLIDYMKNPSPSTCLMLETAEDSVLKKYPEITRYASVQRFGEMSGGEFSVWIKDFMAKRKKRISAGAASLLKEMYGYDMLALTQELEKLATFVGEKAEVDTDDVEDVVGKSLISSTFDLADAIGSNKADNALRICNELMSAGKKEYEIIGLLCWHFKRLLRARTLRSRGESDNYTASVLRVGQKYRAGFFRQVARLGIGQIKAGICVLLEADMDIKRTRLDYAHSALVLEFAIIRLSQIFSD